MAFSIGQISDHWKTSKTRPSESIVVVTTLKDKNGDDIVVPLEVNGISDIGNNTEINAHILSTAYGKENLFDNLVKNAIDKENSGNVGFYYLSKKGASILRSARVQFPGRLIIDAPTHRITDNDSPVKPNISSQIQTMQFKDWFGDWKNEPAKASKVVDEYGKPLVVYHGTNENFNVFDATKTRPGNIQGMYFSPYDIDAGGYGSNLRAFYLNIRKPANEAQYYKALNKFIGQENRGEKAREYLEKQGYDGVVFNRANF